MLNVKTFSFHHNGLRLNLAWYTSYFKYYIGVTIYYVAVDLVKRFPVYLYNVDTFHNHVL